MYAYTFERYIERGEDGRGDRREIGRIVHKFIIFQNGISELRNELRTGTALILIFMYGTNGTCEKAGKNNHLFCSYFDLFSFCSYIILKNDMAEMKIMTINVRGVRNPQKRGAFFEYLRTCKFDVCLMQEVHLTDEKDVGIFTNEWRWGGLHGSGLGVLCGNREIKIVDSLLGSTGEGYGGQHKKEEF